MPGPAPLGGIHPHAWAYSSINPVSPGSKSPSSPILSYGDRFKIVGVNPGGSGNNKLTMVDDATVTPPSPVSQAPQASQVSKAPTKLSGGAEILSAEGNTVTVKVPFKVKGGNIDLARDTAFGDARAAAVQKVSGKEASPGVTVSQGDAKILKATDNKDGTLTITVQVNK